MEHWIDAVGLEGRYEVSSEGRVRNPRRGNRVLSFGGYQRYFRFGTQVDGVRVYVSVHRLICESFHGPAPEAKPLVLHRNGNPHDNRPENLYWGNAIDNMRDKITHGRNSEKNKSHCKRGHEFSTENTYTTPQGHRSCRICRRAAVRKSHQSASDTENFGTHGSHTAYGRGCRCEPCRKARSDYKKSRRASRS